MRNFKRLLIGVLFFTFLYSCSDDDVAVVEPLKNAKLANALKEMGFEVQNNQIVKNEKLQNTRYLNLSGKDIEMIEGLEVFENLEVLNLENNKLKTFNLSLFPQLKQLNLSKNKELGEIEGLDKYNESLLEKLILPFGWRHKFGALPLFVKERAKKNSQFSAKIEKNSYGNELRDYNYYYVFKDQNVANYIFRFLGEGNFIVVNKNGKATEAIDMSKKIELSKENDYNLKILASRVETYEDVEVLINEGFKFFELPLKSFELTTDDARRIESLDMLDFSGYKELENVKIDQMPIKEVHFEECAQLKSLEIGNSNLVESAVPKKPELTTLSLKDSPLLESLNINSMPTLKTMAVNKEAPIKVLKLKNLGVSTIENLNTSHLEKLDIQELEKMTEMNILSDKLTDVTVTYTQIAELDFSNVKKLSGEIIIGENSKLTKLIFPKTANQECKKIQFYRNKIEKLDLSMYKKIGVLFGVVATGKVYMEKEGIKGAEENLKELLIDVDNLIANLPPSSGKDWDGSNKSSMNIYLDADFIKKSIVMKQLFEKGGTDKTKPYIKIYKYGYRYREYRNVGAVRKITDFE